MELLIKPHIRIEQSPTKNIIIDEKNGEFYECNETAVFLIKKLLQGSSREDLIQALLSAYDLNDKDAYTQVDQCLLMLVNTGMLDESN